MLTPSSCATYVVEAIGLPAGISGYGELHRQVFAPMMFTQLLSVFHNDVIFVVDTRLDTHSNAENEF